MEDKKTQIRELNDRFRSGAPEVPGQTVMTRGLAGLLEETSTAPEDLMYQVRSFDAFTADNDPHGEHDFGAFEFLGEKCFWKIDYYDPTLKWGSEDPSDVSKTARVLTIMLASEY
ncbi:DUF3768 domain-containing protein [uncultured Litoreibacter sp.]|uniref:DUF3768 domain-containing protein n=1 Tax=uncultured Litoreibacter sp. TaxID=1392394 RepID=UPI00261E725D|nr:DUF3768 domain-containing protein [uncultured Litoreibacter sp.]